MENCGAGPGHHEAGVYQCRHDLPATPHHPDTLAVYGDEVCRTLLDKRALSQNLGHSSMTTTEFSYGTLDQQMVTARPAGLTSQGAVDDISAVLVEADPEALEFICVILGRSRHHQAQIGLCVSKRGRRFRNRRSVRVAQRPRRPGASARGILLRSPTCATGRWRRSRHGAT